MRGSSDEFPFTISIHALRVEGDLCEECHNKMHPISIHALRVEGDVLVMGLFRTHENFYPRPPGGGRQQKAVIARCLGFISIHALRVEGDSKNGQSFHLFLRKREKNLPL